MSGFCSAHQHHEPSCPRCSAQPSSKQQNLGPKQPPRIHGERCICGDNGTNPRCPVKDYKPPAKPSKELVSELRDVCRLLPLEIAGRAADEIERLQSEKEQALYVIERMSRAASEPSVSLSVYESAVNGRRDFREAYKQARDLLNRFVAAWEGNGENMDRLCELARTGATTEPPRAAATTPVSSAAVDFIQSYMFDVHNAKYSRQMCRALLENALTAVTKSEAKLCRRHVGPGQFCNLELQPYAGCPLHDRPAEGSAVGEIDGR